MQGSCSEGASGHPRADGAEKTARGGMLTGAGASVTLFAVPVYLSEIAPAKIRGNGGVPPLCLSSARSPGPAGVLMPLGIVLGMLATQLLGLHFAAPTRWRAVLVLSCALAAAQLAGAPHAAESPRWLGARGAHGARERARVEAALWGTRPGEQAAVCTHDVSLTGVACGGGCLLAGAVGDVEDHDPLLEADADVDVEDAQPPPVTSVAQLLCAPALRRPLLVVAFAMLSAQLSGGCTRGAVLCVHSFSWCLLMHLVGGRDQCG